MRGGDGERASSGKLMFIGEGVALLSVDEYAENELVVS